MNWPRGQRHGRGECHIVQCCITQADIETACARVMFDLFAVQHAGSALNQIALQGEMGFVPSMKPFSEGFGSAILSMYSSNIAGSLPLRAIIHSREYHVLFWGKLLHAM